MKPILLSVIVMVLALCTGTVTTARADNPPAFGIAFYNLENLFDTINGNGKYDKEFSPDGARKWDSTKYRSKISNIAYVLSRLTTASTPDGPAVIGLSEVENIDVLKDLVAEPALADRHLEIVHRDSPDPRGVDVALLYDPACFKVNEVECFPLRIPGRPDFRTRDQLCVIGELGSPQTGYARIAFIVNHWPSRRDGEQESSHLREAAADLNRSIADSLLRLHPDIGIITMGDLNDDPYNKSVSRILGAVREKSDTPHGGFFNPFWKRFDHGYGSYVYRGGWNLFDQIIVNSNIVDGSCGLRFLDARVFNRPFLLQKHGRYKGYPRRTFSAGVWTNGFSDHLPTEIFLVPHTNTTCEEYQSITDQSLWASAILNPDDNIFYQAANYDFSIARFRQRGLQSTWHTDYINGFDMNSPLNGRFFYSMLGGMTSSAFRNRTTDLPLELPDYGFGAIGGSENFSTRASEFAPGWRGTLSYTNSSYMLRALLQYSTGVSPSGWAFSAAMIGRYAPEGAIEGTFLNSFGYFLSLEKIFRPGHSINISTWGAPTQRALNSATTREAYELAGSNLYNPSWGYLDGKKKSERITESFDPSVMVNWIWNPKTETRLNSGIAFRSNHYSVSGLNWYQAADPRPDYYRNLPSYFNPTADTDLQPELYEQQLAQKQFVADWWGGDVTHRQIDWNAIYQTNLLNCSQYDRDPDLIGMSTYILENRHSDFNSTMFNSSLDMSVNDRFSVRGGIYANFTDARYYKTVRNLLGGEFWRDIDNFSERDYALDPNLVQNDLDNPNRKVTEGDKFGYDYHIRDLNTRLWGANQFESPHWSVGYGAEVSLSSFQREGLMRNGRAPGGFDSMGNQLPSSKGYGTRYTFINFGLKGGATFKIDGRNYLSIRAAGGTRAPFPDNIYISPRTKDAAIPDPQSESYISADVSYSWNYRSLRGSVTPFYNRLRNGCRRYAFYDYDLNSFMNYALRGIDTEYNGIELGLEVFILSNLSISAAGSFASYKYVNNPTGIRNYENGAEGDVERRVFLKGYNVGGAPAQVVSFEAKYNKANWFFEINAQWLGDNWFEISPSRHEDMPGLRDICSSEEEYELRREHIARQEMLNHEWLANLSIGKMIYTGFGSVNVNLSVYNILDNRNIQTGGWQDGKFDYKSFDPERFPNKIWYAQGLRVYLNLGIRF